eukprot:5688078-Amphidinium_carterae.1
MVALQRVDLKMPWYSAHRLFHSTSDIRRSKCEVQATDPSWIGWSSVRRSPCGGPQMKVNEKKPCAMTDRTTLEVEKDPLAVASASRHHPRPLHQPLPAPFWEYAGSKLKQGGLHGWKKVENHKMLVLGTDAAALSQGLKPRGGCAIET